MKLLLFAISLSCIGCTGYKNELKKVYDVRQEMIQTFKNISVFMGERMPYTFVYTYDSGRQNSYIFSRKQNEYFFERENILFRPDRVLNITTQESSAAYRKELKVKLDSYREIMDSLRISDVSSDFVPQGVNLKVYMKSKAILVYVSNPST